MLRVIILSLLVLTGCATQEPPKELNRVTVVASGDLSFLDNKPLTYAWHPTHARIRVNDELNEQQVAGLLYETIASVMKQKGYQQVSIQDNPSVVIGFGAALESAMGDDEILQRVGLVPGLSVDGVDSSQYQKGSVLIALFGNDLTRPNWQVIGQGLADLKAKREQREPRLKEEVQLMLNNVPPTQRFDRLQ
ncbi:DUF4136 domain-containing protein [Paraferrimonas haliotis]|uniref:DUF4136 domain-containing protein n=1 Tax=Paraferrimonas haliotis TaxID=2013866 RepID=A0AA37TQI6_9GAMM|nr:DUF4136 domain-containing protein [Paraferrimonas haliotis]GLS83550.1 hypothetical protein GCM10007894_15270 [Paraferrimonas haliotis]